MYTLLSQIDPNVCEEGNYFEGIEDGLFNSYIIDFKGTYCEVIKPEINTPVELIFSGSTSGTFTYNEQAGLYEAVTYLETWNNISFSFVYDNGSESSLYYHNVQLVGAITSEDVLGCDWTEKLYHDDNVAEKFFTYTGGLYSFTFDPNTNTLMVTYLSKTEDMNQVISSTANDLSGYYYAGGCDYFGESLLVLKLSSNTEGQNLETLRFEICGSIYWIKDYQVINQNGVSIPYETLVTSEGTYIVIDLLNTNGEVSSGTIHVHVGGYNDAYGDLTIEAWLVK